MCEKAHSDSKMGTVGYKSHVLLNSNNDCQISVPATATTTTTVGRTVVNTLFACVSRNFTSEILLAKKFLRQQAEMAFLLAI